MESYRSIMQLNRLRLRRIMNRKKFPVPGLIWVPNFWTETYSSLVVTQAFGVVGACLCLPMHWRPLFLPAGKSQLAHGQKLGRAATTAHFSGTSWVEPSYLHRLHFGRVSSHLTLRVLHVAQPVLVLLIPFFGIWIQKRPRLDSFLRRLG